MTTGVHKRAQYEGQSCRQTHHHTVVIRYLGADDTPLTRMQTRKWMVGAVARAFSPGCKFDHILTFTGPQGVGKSTFLNAIAGRWFSDSFSFAHDDKSKIEDITGAWIVEISELNGMKRAGQWSVIRTKIAYYYGVDSFNPVPSHTPDKLMHRVEPTLL